MVPNDDRVAAALSGCMLRASGADEVLAARRDPGGLTDPPTSTAPPETHRRHDAVIAPRALRQVFDDHDSELLGWP